MRGDILSVAEIFHSRQGEGIRTGEKSHFIRFSGCNLNCWFCDTLSADPKMMTINEIAGQISRLESGCEWIVLTGGEPLIHDQYVLKKLVNILKSKGYLIQLETNGTIGTEIDFDHITVSPKRESINAGLDPSRIREIKVLAETGDSPKRYLPDIPHFLQPIDSTNRREANTRFCEKFVADNPIDWRLSLQMHKVWGIR